MESKLPEQIESERLVIRVARPGDGAMFNQAILESIDRLSPWLAWANPPPPVEVSEETCRRAHERFLRNEDLMAFFLLKDGGSLVGGSGLHDADWDLRSFEIGYWGRSAFAGRGLITEGVRALAGHALGPLAANRVLVVTDDLNVASWKLAERCGFELEGILRNERRNLAGRLRDTRIYSRIPSLAARSFCLTR
jgi:RimJ/RimL family protein N-acetyltransferase